MKKKDGKDLKVGDVIVSVGKILVVMSIGHKDNKAYYDTKLVDLNTEYSYHQVGYVESIRHLYHGTSYQMAKLTPLQCLRYIKLRVVWAKNEFSQKLKKWAKAKVYGARYGEKTQSILSLLGFTLVEKRCCAACGWIQFPTTRYRRTNTYEKIVRAGCPYRASHEPLIVRHVPPNVANNYLRYGFTDEDFVRKEQCAESTPKSEETMSSKIQSTDCVDWNIEDMTVSVSRSSEAQKK